MRGTVFQPIHQELNPHPYIVISNPVDGYVLVVNLTDAKVATACVRCAQVRSPGFSRLALFLQHVRDSECVLQSTPGRLNAELRTSMPFYLNFKIGSRFE